MATQNDPFQEPTGSLSNVSSAQALTQAEAPQVQQPDMQFGIPVEPQAQPQQAPQEPIQDPFAEEPQLTTGENFRDIIESPLRGVLAAANNIYQLADFVMADKLPDQDLRIMGESKTTVGKFGEAITDFMVGFAVGGVVGKGVVKGLGALSSATKAANIAKLSYSAEAALANPFIGGTFKGAVSDFGFMDAHQERLANIVNEIPGLKNPVSEFLANNGDEGELEGRIKNALEGAGVGVAVEALGHMIGAGVKAIKKGSELRAKGVPPEEVAKEMEKLADAGIPSDANMAKQVIPEAAQAVESKLSVEQMTEPQRLATQNELDFRAKVTQGADELVINAGTPSKKLNDAITEAVTTGKSKAVQNVFETLHSSLDDTIKKLDPQTREDMVVEATNWMKTFGDDSHMAAMVRSNDVNNYIIKTRMMSVATSDAVQQMARELAPKIESGAITAEERAKFIDMVLEMNKIQAKYSDVRAMWGRGGNAMQADITTSEGLKNALEAVNKKRSPEYETFHNTYSKPITAETEADMAKRTNDLIRRIVGANRDSVGQVALKSVSITGRVYDALLETWIGSLIGIPSAVVNIMGQTLVTALKPLEMGIKAAWKDPKMARAVTARYAEAWHSLGNAFDIMRRNFLKDDMVTNIGNRMDDRPNVKAMSAAAFGKDDGSPIGRVINFWGGFARFGLRINTAVDEGIKYLNFRGAAAGKLTYEALSNPNITTPEMARDYVAMRMRDLIDQSGRVYDQPSIAAEGYKEAMKRNLKGTDRVEFIEEYVASKYNPANSALVDYAKAEAGEATFSRGFDPETAGAFGQAVIGWSSYANKYPIVRLVTPFIRTPAEILRFISERNPLMTWPGVDKIAPGLGQINKGLMAELASPDPVVKAAAEGKFYTGSMLYGMGGMLALNGVITGYGPDNPNERKALIATGWQPYSFVVGDKYIAFNRLDPLASFFGIVADSTEYMKRGIEMNEDVHTALFQASVLPIVKNITNKTYLTGISDVIDLLQADPKSEKVVMNRLASIIPSLVANTRGTIGGDFTVGEARNYADAVLKRIPGASQLVDRNRNLLGETVDNKDYFGRRMFDWMNPIAISSRKGDPVMEEVAKLRHGFSMPKSKIGNVDLTTYEKGGQSAYDRWQELTGTMRIGGSTLRNDIQRLMKSEGYKKLSEISTIDYDSPRIRLINNIVRKYRSAAFRTLKKEYPELAQAHDEYFRVKQGLRRGSQLQQLVNN